MIRLSMNVVSSAMKLLKYIAEGDVKSTDDVSVLYKIGNINIRDLMEMLEICRLLETSNVSQNITKSGKMIVDEYNRNNFGNSIRIFLEKYVLYAAPTWSRRIPYGRKETIVYMTKDEQSCFYEAALLSVIPTDDEILWWDKISSLIRNENDKIQTGRIGEKLTVKYEMWRTGERPKWMAIETSLIGYDILSVVSKGLQMPLLIEVKTSRDDMSRAVGHITSHEWEVSQTSTSYLFYFWLLVGGLNKLAILDCSDIASHIPLNNRDGKWESVKIPFYTFKDKFFEWRGEN